MRLEKQPCSCRDAQEGRKLGGMSAAVGNEDDPARMQDQIHLIAIVPIRIRVRRCQPYSFNGTDRETITCRFIQNSTLDARDSALVLVDTPNIDMSPKKQEKAEAQQNRRKGQWVHSPPLDGKDCKPHRKENAYTADNPNRP